MVKRDFGVIEYRSDIIGIHQRLSETSGKHNVVCDNVVMPSLTTMKGTLSGGEDGIEKVVASIKLQFPDITFVLSESRK